MRRRVQVSAVATLLVLGLVQAAQADFEISNTSSERIRIRIGSLTGEVADGSWQRFGAAISDRPVEIVVEDRTGKKVVSGKFVSRGDRFRPTKIKVSKDGKWKIELKP